MEKNYNIFLRKKSVTIKLDDDLKDRLKDTIENINDYDIIKIKLGRTFFKQKRYYKICARKKFGFYKTLLSENDDSYFFMENTSKIIRRVFNEYDVNCYNLYPSKKYRYGPSIFMLICCSIILIVLLLGISALSYIFKGYFLAFGLSLF
ncbi:hypothetical protein F352_123 [Campylobacter phage F352]|uniref:Uncharacterized protein n=4 Tax=Fletchervirus CPX TaxID=1110702 RepID=A0A7T3N5D3_9CAUD|nr:hypothetical protein F348_126 [Campylobacter phage F348]QPX63427.1 hypothetical protein F352_123 [Campylobacter phage F352]QPX65563.1 hypothetical protein F374_122 [Campylobacter phage F374]QPX65730.1 hypothetical protein F375_123 [Campylobacter phage F375]QXO05988.1 hypothetical protein [Campylobacter phage CJLB-10]